MEQVGNTRFTRIILYTDQPLLAYGVSALLSTSGMFEILSANVDISLLKPLVERVQPDLILIDLTSEITVGLLRVLGTTSPLSQIVLWGRRLSEELVSQSRELGIAGFINRGCSSEQFLEALSTIATGGKVFDTPGTQRSTKIDLTPRESQLVALLAQGLRNKEIGSCLGITEGTVRVYLSKLFVKVGARDRLELAVFGLKNSFCGQSSWDGQNSFVTESDEGRARPALRSLILVEPARRAGYAHAVTVARGQ